MVVWAWLGVVFAVATACASSGVPVAGVGSASSGPVATIRVVVAPGTTAEDTAHTYDVIAARSNAFGGTVTHDGDTIVVTVPTAVASAAAHLVTQPGELQFRPVLGEYPPDTSTPDSVKANCTASATTPECLLAVPETPQLTSPADLANPDARNQVVVLAQLDPKTSETVAIFKLGPTLLDDTALVGATADNDSPNGEWQVNPVFLDGQHGIDLLNAVAAHCYASDAVCPQIGGSASHGQLAVVLDNHVVTAPTIDAPSFTKDEIRISGAFDEASADTLAAILNSGPLPAAVTATSG